MDTTHIEAQGITEVTEVMVTVAMVTVDAMVTAGDTDMDTDIHHTDTTIDEVTTTQNIVRIK